MSRTNLEALKARCKVICNTCYVDTDVAEDMLLREGLAPTDNDVDESTITKCAIIIVKGWVETSRTDNGITASVNYDAVKKSIAFWCKQCGLDASEFLDEDLTTIEDGSHLW